MASDGSLDGGRPVTAGDEQPFDLQRRSAGLSDTARLVLAVVLVCALVVAVATGIFLVLQRNDSSSSSLNVDATMRAQLEQRAEIQSAAEAFVVNLNSYSQGDFAGYRDRLAPLVTPNFMQAFVLTLDSMEKLVDSTKMTSEGTVLQTAVSTMDSDSATALVVADAQVSSLLGERKRHFRWKVILVNKDGTWVVDDWQAVV